MKLSLMSRRNKKIFESKINKKSRFLRSLPQKKYEGIKKVEEGKTELIIDKILGIGEFERNYAFFSNNKIEEKEINDNLKKKIKPSLKNRISDLVHKESQNKYEEINENYENRYNTHKVEKERKYNNANKYWRINKNRKIEKEKDEYESFFSKMGNKVILNELLYSNEKGRNQLYNSENFDLGNKIKKYNFTEN